MRLKPFDVEGRVHSQRLIGLKAIHCCRCAVLRPIVEATCLGHVPRHSIHPQAAVPLRRLV